MLFAVNAAAQTVIEGTTSGKCGDNITWSYDFGLRTLTLTGSGRMYDYEETSDLNAPWNSEIILDFSGVHFDVNIKNYIDFVVIDQKIESIGNYAFYYASLKHINLDYIKSIGTGAFKKCENLKITSLPTNTTIGDDAFRGCAQMADEGVIYIGNTLVQLYESGKNSVTIKAGTTTIQKGAFKNKQIETITFADNSLTTIGDEAFSGCSNLKTLDIPNTVTTWGQNIFSGCTSLLNDETETYQKAGDHVIVKVSKKGEKQYRIPSNIIYIAENAFSACDQVTKIVSEHTTTIPQAATSAFSFTKIETPNIYVEDGKESECANKWGIAATKINHTTIPVGSTGYATVSLEHSAQIPSGVKAYTVYVEDGQIKLKQVSKLAKHVGYMLYGDVKNHTFTPLKYSYSETEDNDLVGLQEDQVLSGADKYLLTSRDGDVKFRCLDKTSKVLTAGKAYLSVPNATASEYSVRIISDDDTETDIDETLENNAHANNRTIYNIAGQRVNQPRQGLNIIDGKLVIM